MFCVSSVSLLLVGSDTQSTGHSILPRIICQRFSTDLCLLPGRRVLAAQQAVGGLVLLDGWEAAQLLIKAVVRVVVVALAHLAQQHRAETWLHGKVVVEVGRDGDALPRGQ